MEIDASLMEIFLGEVGSYTAILEDVDASMEAKGDAAHGLKGITAMLGFDLLSQIAAKLEKEIRAGESSNLKEALTKIKKAIVLIKKSRRDDGSHSGTLDALDGNQENQSAEFSVKKKETKKEKKEGKKSHVEKESQRQEKKVNEIAKTEEEENDAEWDDETTAMLSAIFQEEAQELICGMERALETLTEDNSNKDAINELFRQAHTIKGAGATVGLSELSKAAHNLENEFEKIRSGSRKVTSTDIKTFLHAVEILTKMVAECHDPNALEKHNRELLTVLADKSADEPNQAAHSGPSKTSDTATHPQHSAGSPATTNSHGLSNAAPHVLCEDRKKKAKEGKAKELKKVDEQREYKPAPELRKEDRRSGGRRDEDLRIIRIPVERVDSLMDSVGELVFARTRIHRRTDELAGLLKDISLSHRALRNTLVGIGLRALDHRLLQRFSEVEVEFADEVSNLERAVANLSQETDWLRRLTATIQEGLIGLRMMSVSFLMTRLKRAAREMARKLEKEITINLEGEDTELDKSVAERLTEPLIHIVRNALAHGIETREERKAAGKNPEGQIAISAKTEGEYVLIEVSDDGKGIDLRKVRSTVIKKKLLPKSKVQRLRDEKAIELIFLPGFTTKETADQISGRGVGLDSVMESISALSGEINVKSKKGKGTTFFLRLPLLTTITNALLFKVGGEVYALSLTHVGETVLFAEDEVNASLEGNGTIQVKGEKIRLVDLPRLLGVERKGKTDKVQGFIGKWGSEKFAVTCDRVIGPREIVVKPLGDLLASLPHYCGATISGAGKVQLVLDAAALAKSAGATMFHDRGFERDPQKSPRVLLCDDSRSIREVVSRILLHAGFEVEKANDGWDAWERMNGTEIDLLLTDLEMPRLDGYGLIERVRREEKFSRLPIIVLTSRTGETNKKRAGEVGANRFVTKPVNKRVILKHIQDLLPTNGSHKRFTSAQKTP